MTMPDAAMKAAVKKTGAAVSNLIGILGTWQPQAGADLQLRYVATDRLAMARAVLLDLWHASKDAPDLANGKEKK